jgi:uncharacterized protein YlaI
MGVRSCGKTRYRTRSDAERALKTITRHSKKGDERPVRSYPCSDCGGHHLTSSPA